MFVGMGEHKQAAIYAAYKKQINDHLVHIVASVKLVWVCRNTYTFEQWKNSK
jgi:hypothetical protein